MTRFMLPFVKHDTPAPSCGSQESSRTRNMASLENDCEE